MARMQAKKKPIKMKQTERMLVQRKQQPYKRIATMLPNK